MPRKESHAKETRTRDMVRTKIDSYYENGDAVFREWSEVDYGIDAVVELFNNGFPTGKIAFIQLKGTEKTIEPLKNSPNTVSCSNISSSCLEYARQDKIPMILIFASLTDPQCFYYVDLQSQIDDVMARAKEGQESHTVHIPVENYAEDDLSGFFELIKSFYN